LPGKITLKGGA
jgi:hypothetical protein